MNEENIKNIVQKYKAGNSNLKEENALFNSEDNKEDSIKLWASYVKKNKITTPVNLNDKLWLSFEKNHKSKPKIKLWLFAAAASIVLLFATYINSIDENRMSYSEKQALLNEAKNMIATTDQNDYIHHIILENELVVVYTKSKK